MDTLIAERPSAELKPTDGVAAPAAASAKRNIRFHLLKIVIAAVASMAAITFGSLLWNISAQRQLAEAEMARTARAFSVALDESLLKTLAALESLAVVLIEGTDPSEFYGIASAVTARHPHWSHVTLRDSDGQPIFTTALPFGAAVPQTAENVAWMVEALRTGEPQVTNLLYGRISNSHVAGVFLPIAGKDGARYGLGASITAAKWTRLLQDQHIPSGWVAGIIDRNGIVVARTRGAESFVGKPAPDWVLQAISSAPEGSAAGPAFEGERLSVVYARSGVSGWTVAFAAPSSVLEAPLRRSLLMALFASGLALGIGIPLVLIFARNLSRSVSGLVQTVEALQVPGAPLPPPGQFNVLEVASLYDAMRSASIHLERAEEQRHTSMRELQHRVKNDLQAVTSLIAMESRRSVSGETRRILQELRGRIEALRLAHSRLYEASEVGKVELGGYLRELCGNFLALYGRRRDGTISLNASTDEAYVDHTAAVSIGLIVNEFITNSAKHAFPNGIGTITLDLKVQQPDRIELRVADDGIGLPGKRARSSGLHLIEMLVEQMGAQSEWQVDGGTSLRLTFPNVRA
jgi:two-component sensor histidine kinase